MAFNSRKFVREFMCQQVRVDRVFERTFDSHGARGWATREVDPFVGWVVGVIWLQSGWYVSADYDEPAHLQESGARTLCYLVTKWPTQRPWRVPPEAVTVLSEPVEPSFLNDDERKLYQEWGARLPRDEKGRFVSGPMLPKEDDR